MKNKQSGFIIPLILSIIAILAVGGGVYVYQENKKVEVPVPVVDTNTQATVETQQTATQNPSAVTQQNTVNTSVSVSATLKTYTNSKHGYSIQYPSDAVVTSVDSGTDASSCVSIKKGLGFILINSGANDPCGSTGVGIGAIRIQEEVQVGDKKYTSTGFTSKTNTTDYFFSFDVAQNTSIYFGMNSLTSNAEYVKALSDIKVIISTFKSIPIVTTSTTVSSDVSSPKLVLIYPDTEDNTDDFKRGTTINIQWNTVNKTDFPIDIHLLNESGISVQKIATNISNTGSYSWSIPTTLAAGKYKIEVDSSPIKQGPAIYTQSGYFTLK
ncbi:MAG: Ser-Thr-rich GPI-anchored membrane family protein [Patescibacteria group bacterium]